MNITNLSPKAASKEIHKTNVILTEKSYKLLQKMILSNPQQTTNELINECILWLYCCSLDYKELLENNDPKTHKIAFTSSPVEIQELWNIQQAWFEKHYSLSAIVNTAINMKNWATFAELSRE